MYQKSCRKLNFDSLCDLYDTHELIDQVYSSIIDFTDGEEQSDDITMLALRYLGSM